jgi:thiol-disulfide isomerase/thioredoxin
MGADMAVRIRAAVLALALAVPLAGCSRGGDERSYGGAEGLPGPLPAGVEFAEPPSSGVPAPEFTAELVDGTEVEAADLWADRPAVLLFTASWCETCRDVHRAVAEAVGERDGAVSLLAVVPEDDADAAAGYAEELELAYPVAVGTDRIWLDYAAREPPLAVLVAPGGTVLRGWPGGVERAALAEELDSLIAASPSGFRR